MGAVHGTPPRWIRVIGLPQSEKKLMFHAAEQAGMLKAHPFAKLIRALSQPKP